MKVAAFTVLFLFSVFSCLCYAAISLNSTSYSENFDSMGVTGTAPPTDWVAFTSGAGGGTSPPALLYLPSNSGTPVGGISNGNYNGGLSAGYPSGNLNDRSLGIHVTSQTGSRDITATFVNNTGSAIANFTILYDLEAWYSRLDNTTLRTAAVNMQFDGGSGFVNMGASFNTAVTNATVTTPGGLWLTSPIVASVSGVTYTPASPIPNGATFRFRWNGMVGGTTPPNQNMVASIDNFYYLVGTASYNITVNLAHGISLFFPVVTDLCSSSATILGSLPGGPPGGYRFIGDAYDITTCAAYAPYATVTIPYNESQVVGQGVSESSLKMFHWENGAWHDVTVSVDTVSNTITGRVNALSPFGIGYPYTGGGGGGYSTGANENMIALIAIFTISAGIFILRRQKWIKG